MTRPQALVILDGLHTTMKYLAIDLGDRRTGLAVGDLATGMALPLEVVTLDIRAGGGEALLAALVERVKEHAPAGLVVGLPLNMDGTEGPRARGVRQFADQLARRTGLPLHFQDERLTTAEADWRMARTGMTRAQKKDRRDALAAAALLADYLAARRGDDPGAAGASNPGPGA